MCVVKRSGKLPWRTVLRHNGKQLLIAFDQLLGVVTATCLREKAWADMTLSATAHLNRLRGVRTWEASLIDALLWFDRNHCEESYESEKIRNQTPPELRQ